MAADNAGNKEDSNFLGRWSRLKAEARSRSAPKGEETSETPLEKTAPPPADAGPDANLAETEAEIALEDLPRIEEIDAKTDLTPWLAKKVPAAWRAAALRKAWSSDPTISGFVGLAEYAWDWNAPGGMPGFEPLDAIDSAARLLAEVTSLSAESPEKATLDFDNPQANAPVSASAHCDRSSTEEELPDDATAIEDAAAEASEKQMFTQRKRSGSALPV